MNVNVNDNSVSKNVVANNSKHVKNPHQPFKVDVDARLNQYKTTKVGGFRWFCGEKHT
jgi:hypothetical protein